MPRPNRPRSVMAEQNLAQRIALEREARGWTTEGLAKRMTDAGCAVTGSAIYKIEKGEPRRRIVVDELVALSQVFNIPVEELLLPPEAVIDRQLTRRLLALGEAELEAEASRAKVMEMNDDLLKFIQSQLGMPGSRHHASWQGPLADSYRERLEEYFTSRGEALTLEERRLKRAIRLPVPRNVDAAGIGDGEHPEAQ